MTSVPRADQKRRRDEKGLITSKQSSEVDRSAATWSRQRSAGFEPRTAEVPVGIGGVTTVSRVEATKPGPQGVGSASAPRSPRARLVTRQATACATRLSGRAAPPLSTSSLLAVPSRGRAAYSSRLSTPPSRHNLFTGLSTCARDSSRDATGGRLPSTRATSATRRTSPAQRRRTSASPRPAPAPVNRTSGARSSPFAADITCRRSAQDAVQRTGATGSSSRSRFVDRKIHAARDPTDLGEIVARRRSQSSSLVRLNPGDGRQRLRRPSRSDFRSCRRNWPRWFP